MNNPKLLDKYFIVGNQSRRSGQSYRMILLLTQQVKEGKTVMLCGCKYPDKVIEAMKEIGINAQFVKGSNGATFKLKE